MRIGRDVTMGLGATLLGLCILTVGSCSDTGITGAADSLTGLDALVSDVGKEISTLDIPKSELIEPEVEAEECLLGEGCFLEACEENGDCLSGICTQHMGGKVCTEACDEACPKGWRCLLVSGGSDGAYVCVSTFSHLCQPCFTGADCSNESTQNACVLYEGEGAFCGGACDATSPCPDGYSCQDVEVVGGATSYQCVNDASVCSCTDMAIELSMGTFCEESNDAGTCQGMRACVAEGLSDCNADVPAEDVCNGQDDDCDGTLDELGCDDGNPCTEDICSGLDGCVNTPLDGTECLDGDVCTFGDHCEAGACVGNPTVCDDANPCTEDACDESGACAFLNTQGLCDDGEPCTLADTCKEGVCAPGVALQCDDANPCTADTCGELGCVHVPTDEPCDDSNACTVVDVCADGACVGTEPLDCNDDNPCTDDTCHPQAVCLHTANAQPCNDSNACTLGDQCQGTLCASGPVALECTDGNACTNDTCDPLIGCLFKEAFGPCNDKNSCTVDDTCLEGACTGLGTLECDDGNACTLDGCKLIGGCTHQLAEGACSDGDSCTIGDSCTNGTCSSGGALNCDDGNPCTSDGCDAGGCVFLPLAIACDDGNACTLSSSCKDGSCQGTTGVVCDDGNPCTLNFCHPEKGCVAEANVAPCDDGSVCTVGDVCTGGNCQSGPILSCSDGNPCTDDSCNVAAGCVFSQNVLPCNDGNACTVGDTCAAGACAAQVNLVCDDGNSCTKDSCDPVTGCKSVVIGGGCDDGNACTTVDLCDGLDCVGSVPLQCGDGDPCTSDGCEPKPGCVYAFKDGFLCDDGDACTGDDACKNGQCQGTVDLECDDANPCTDDSCLKVQGCKFVANQDLCDDGDPCTLGDHCSQGACIFDDAVSVPGNVGDIVGDAFLCAGTGGHSFSVAQVPGATSYNWSVPEGATIQQGAGTQAITLALGANSGVVKVSAANACGEGNPSALSVTVQVEPDKPGAISGPLQACSTSQSTYSIVPMAGADSYAWVFPDGWEIVDGDGTDVVTVEVGQLAGTVSVTAINECGESAVKTLAVESKQCLPPGIIVSYTGFVGNLPQGWYLCDGSNGTPNLQSRFVRGAAPGANPGLTGGDASSHAHGDTTGVTQMNTGTTSPSGRNCGGNSCTWKASNTAHNHVFNHGHAMPKVTTDNLPPYYEVLFLQNESAFVLPEGTVAFWNKSPDSLPEGWGLCDGIEATPNLHDRYLRGASQGQSAGNQGGSLTHAHAAKTGSHGDMAAYSKNHSTVGCGGPSATDGSHSHKFVHEHNIPFASHEPPYVTLVPMRALVETATAAGTILLWGGALGDIPDGWTMCDGEGNTPDTRSRFVKGSVQQAGSVGGSETHIHQTGSVSGVSTTSGGGNGNCSNGGGYMGFHSHNVPGHTHVLSTVGNVPEHMELVHIIKL
jgi:hypothetical protein